MGCSLSGKLEELDLGEILQIVSLSRQTGILTLNSKGREGCVYFHNGFVIRATSTGFQQSLGEILVRKGIVDQATVSKALKYQQEHSFLDRLGVILIRQFGIQQNQIEAVVREQIESVVYTLFLWHDGTYCFDTKTDIEAIDNAFMDPMQFMLTEGVSTQHLTEQGSRLQDEYIQAHPEAAVTETPEPAPAVAKTSPLPSRPVLVIVDDDAPTAQAIAEQVDNAGYETFALAGSEEALIKVDALYRSSSTPTVLVDLIMPKMDGSGVLGGLELIDIMKNNFKDINILVMSDFHNSDAEEQIKAAGLQFILKPKRGDIKTEAFGNFISSLVHELHQLSGS
jgi:CheY-like chemotaxis protein